VIIYADNTIIEIIRIFLEGRNEKALTAGAPCDGDDDTAGISRGFVRGGRERRAAGRGGNLARGDGIGIDGTGGDADGSTDSIGNAIR
jgi:hypothetical protein